MQIYYFQGLHGSFFEQKIQGLFKEFPGHFLLVKDSIQSKKESWVSLVLQQHEQFHPEGFFVFAGLDKVSTEIQGLSSSDYNFQGPSRWFLF